LWPAVDPMPNPNTQQNRIKFLGDFMGSGVVGHGDGVNAGFLRADAQGSSLLAIVIVSDEDDCSSSRTDDVAELAQEQRNLRCFLHKQALYETSRYSSGFRALRPGHEDLVLFAAIVGVPKDLVDKDARAAVSWRDTMQRDAYYARILSDPRMQEVPVVSPGPHKNELLRPSCQSAHGLADPPRRIVQVAKDFGENGIVQSVCQDDFGPAMDAIIELIGSKIGSICVPHKQVRNSDGLVRCNVLWELPMAGAERPGTPTQCGQEGFPFLMPPGPGTEPRSKNGGAVCNVAQLAVVDDPSAPDMKRSVPTTTSGQLFEDGWYYDNYSSELKDKCRGENQQRLAFTSKATPPNGVRVRLECLDERQALSSARTDTRVGSRQPSIGDACDGAGAGAQSVGGDQACEVALSAPTTAWPDAIDRSMFCHPKQNLCVRPCSTDTDCPEAWVCDLRSATLQSTISTQRPQGSPICVNPTCGDAN
jgi:hypothetical protein